MDPRVIYVNFKQPLGKDFSIGLKRLGPSQLLCRCLAAA